MRHPIVDHDRKAVRGRERSSSRLHYLPLPALPHSIRFSPPSSAFAHLRCVCFAPPDLTLRRRFELSTHRHGGVATTE
jgi:hypothetical protein